MTRLTGQIPPQTRQAGNRRPKPAPAPATREDRGRLRPGAADEIAREEADEYAKQQVDDAYREVYDEAYGDAYERAYTCAMVSRST